MIFLVLVVFGVGYVLSWVLSCGLDRLSFWASFAVHLIGLICSLGVVACGLVLTGAI